MAGRGPLLPQWGFLALGPQTGSPRPCTTAAWPTMPNAPIYLCRRPDQVPAAGPLQAETERRRPGRLHGAPESARDLDRLRPLATDGAMKINRAKDRLVLFPYPRGRHSAEPGPQGPRPDRRSVASEGAGPGGRRRPGYRPRGFPLGQWPAGHYDGAEMRAGIRFSGSRFGAVINYRTPKSYGAAAAVRSKVNSPST